MLVGLPGSGKSTFSDLLLTSDYKIKILNQDNMGRKKCEDELLKSIKEFDIVVLDRTNYTKEDRENWIKLTMLNPSNCLCIFFKTDKILCINRVKNRENHPTIKKGSGERIINDIEKKLEEPSKEEGFSEIIYLQDTEDVANYLKRWDCLKIRPEINDDLFIHKFVKTPHIFDIGGGTKDDKLLNKEEYDTFFKEEVTICEKVDGAQMGFSIDENYKIVVQNRSHYVNSKTHSQFKILDKWIFDHSDSLYQILDEDTILFGEWLYAKHSVPYDKLPNYFLAFDLYSKSNKIFYNRKILEERLEGTNIIPVRVMYRGLLKNRKQLLNMIQEESEYADHRVEGIYLKIYEGDFVKSRCKLVRDDFICGNEHWNKGIIEKNKLNFL